ncbi:MAG: YceI family protein [Saprospiraceae bacterium]
MKKLSFVLFALGLVVLSSAFMKSTTLKVDVAKSKANWIGKKVTGQHSGTIGIKSGSIIFDNDRPVAGSFVIDMNSIASTDLEGEYAGKLIGHLKSDDFFGVAKYPTANFVLKNAAATVNPVNYIVTGELTIKGTTETVSFDARIDQTSATAKILVDRTKFGIKYGSGSFFENLGDKAIDNMFELNVQLALTK